MNSSASSRNLQWWKWIHRHLTIHGTEKLKNSYWFTETENTPTIPYVGSSVNAMQVFSKSYQLILGWVYNPFCICVIQIR